MKLSRRTAPASKILSVLFGLLLLVSATAAFPQKAQAFLGFGDIVSDPLDTVQNTFTSVSTSLNQVDLSVLNPIAWAVAKAVLQAVVKSTINSVNKGPNGSPQFVTNLNTTLKAVSDTAANGFISQLSSNGSIKSPYQTAVASAVSTQYLQSTASTGFFTQNAYTLNKATTNDAAFLSGNFSQGGLSAWMSAWSNTPNNPFGASMLAANGLAAQVANAQSTQKAELNYGQGFTASRGKCSTTTTGGTTQTSSLSTALTSLSANSTCQSSSIQTPGSTIKTGLDKSLGSGIDTLVNAHTFDEIVNALLGQMISQVVGPGGLTGLSQPVTTSSTTASTAAATTANSTIGSTGYFDQTDPSQAAISNGLSASFSSTLTTQLQQVQQFQANWTTINNAAVAAAAALSTSTCPTASTTLATTVQPVINQSTASLAQASAAITAVQNVQAMIPPANSTASQITALSNVSTAYSALIQGTATSPSPLPSPTDIAYASSESVDVGTTSPATTVYSQMIQIADTANQCTQ